MASGSVDAQFKKAVDIVQGLPKDGPVQTNYEEKLTLYALYKQAVDGDINMARPGMFDMLGRAKWDSWNQQKGVDSTKAKRLYVSTLLKILRKHGNASKFDIADLETWAERPPRPVSPSSSTSSYHSSQASPPLSPTINPPSYVLYPPPDPELPIPDVAPEIIPPSALNSSHRSLLNLLQSPQPVSERSSPNIDLLNSDPGQYPGGSERSKTSLRAFSQSGVGIPGSVSGLGISQVGQQRGQHQPGPSSASVPTLPVREFSPHPRLPMSPDPFASTSYAPIRSLSNQPQQPPSISNFSQPALPPIRISQTLQQIQLSLTALHERQSTLERRQAMLLRREERRRTWFGFFSGSDEELDMLEEDADVESRRAPAVNTKTSTASRARIRRALPFRVIWALLSAIRRAMLDFGVGVLIMLAVSLMVGGGWRRARRTLSRFLIGARDAISGEWQNATRSQIWVPLS